MVHIEIGRQSLNAYLKDKDMSLELIKIHLNKSDWINTRKKKHALGGPAN